MPIYANNEIGYHCGISWPASLQMPASPILTCWFTFNVDERMNSILQHLTAKLGSITIIYSTIPDVSIITMWPVKSFIAILHSYYVPNPFEINIWKLSLQEFFHKFMVWDLKLKGTYLELNWYFKVYCCIDYVKIIIV